MPPTPTRIMNETWRRYRPGPVVFAVFVTGAIGLWVVTALRILYNVVLDPRDVALHFVWAMTLAGWWTELMIARSSGD